MMKVFLDIDIGNREAYDRDLHAHRVTADYLRDVGSQVTLCLPITLPPIAASDVNFYLKHMSCSTAFLLLLKT